MTMHTPSLPRRLLAGACLAAAALAAVPAAAQTATAARTTDFSATFATQEIFIPTLQSDCPAQLRGMTFGSGAATLLGKPTYLQASDCPVMDPASGTFTFTNGTLVMLNLQGDSLRATYSGTMVPMGGTMFRLAGSYTVTGGTGKLRNAAGTGTVGGSIDVSTARGELTANGTLSY